MAYMIQLDETGKCLRSARFSRKLWRAWQRQMPRALVQLVVR